jgi:metal-responsive CopG/Arc/MetJ family transcriptional regulator
MAGGEGVKKKIVIPVNVTFTPLLLEAIDKYTEEYEMTRSEFVRKAVREYLEKYANEEVKA